MWYVGDIVRVRDDLEVDKKYDEWYFVEEMEQYKGMEFEIVDVEITDGIEVYSLDGVSGGYGFTAPMLEDVMPQVNPQIFLDFILEE
jgi:hypothetical protein